MSDRLKNHGLRSKLNINVKIPTHKPRAKHYFKNARFRMRKLLLTGLMLFTTIGSQSGRNAAFSCTFAGCGEE